MAEGPSEGDDGGLATAATHCGVWHPLGLLLEGVLEITQGNIMHKKKISLTPVFSKLLIVSLLAAVFVVGGLAVAQVDVNEPSDGFADTVSDVGNTTSAELSNQAEQSAPAALLSDEPGMSHWFIMGSHLLPRRSDLQYTYNSYGCLSITGGTGNRMQFPVALPDGSRIKSMDVIYRDTSGSNLTVWLSRYDPGVSNSDIIAVSSSGTAGAGTASSSEISHVVDNSQGAYSLIYSWSGVTGSSLQICGIRVNYIDPFHASFLPSVSAD